MKKTCLAKLIKAGIPESQIYIGKNTQYKFGVPVFQTAGQKVEPGLHDLRCYA